MTTTTMQVYALTTSKNELWQQSLMAMMMIPKMHQCHPKEHNHHLHLDNIVCTALQHLFTVEITQKSLNRIFVVRGVTVEARGTLFLARELFLREERILVLVVDQSIVHLIVHTPQPENGTVSSNQLVVQSGTGQSQKVFTFFTLKEMSGIVQHGWNNFMWNLVVMAHAHVEFMDSHRVEHGPEATQISSIPRLTSVTMTPTLFGFEETIADFQLNQICLRCNIVRFLLQPNVHSFEQALKTKCK